MRDIFEADRETRYKSESESKKKQNKKEFDHSFYTRLIGENKDNEGFNKCLCLLVSKECNFEGNEWCNKVSANRNLGHSGYGNIADERIKITLRNMMNSKPDIAIYYERNHSKYLRFIECKYLSDERCYNGVTQTKIQSQICRFLCEEILKDTIADCTEKEGANGNILYFVSKKMKRGIN